MRKSVYRLSRLTLGALLFLSLVVTSACSGSYGTSKNNTTTVTSANAVIMSNFAFSPATITVKAGVTVTWTNKDSSTHTVVSDTGAFTSGNLAVNAPYSYTFVNAGTYNYHCSIHPSMKGTVIVQ